MANGYTNAQTPLYKNAKAPIEERVKDLLSRMTLEEKVAQMRIFHANLGIEWGEKDELTFVNNVSDRLNFGIGGIKNPGELLAPEKAVLLTNQLQKYIISKNRLGIPALFVGEAYNGIDAEGATIFGRPMAQAASFNPDLVHQIWDVIGREARSRGFNMCHSPEADLARDPRFGRMSETFGEDTYLTTEMVVSAVTGVQGDFEGLKKRILGLLRSILQGMHRYWAGQILRLLRFHRAPLPMKFYHLLKRLFKGLKRSELWHLMVI